MNSLTKHFESVGIQLEETQAPLQARSPHIFQLDVAMRRGVERYRLWAGGTRNRAQVVARSPRFRQVVLFVDEPKQSYVLDVPVGRGRWALGSTRASVHRAGGRVLSVKADRVQAEFHTSGQRRHMLLGYDERHLFVCQLPAAASTVAGAHDLLMPNDVRNVPHRRQGEWFFVNASEDEVQTLSQGILHRRRRLGSGGNAHVADEIVRMPEGGVYMRGAVRHIEHKTLQFSRWQRVVRNRELIAANAQLGIDWFD